MPHQSDPPLLDHFHKTTFIVDTPYHILSKPVELYKKVKSKVVPVLNIAPRHEDVLGEWRYSSIHS
jgi:hypothetical protein